MKNKTFEELKEDFLISHSIKGKWGEDMLNDLLQAQRAEMVEKSKQFAERLKLEVDVVQCDCGEKIKDWDIADLINEKIKALTEVKDSVEEIPQMKGTQEALDKLTIRPL